MQKMITYVATPTSKKIMKDAIKAEKDGITQDWDNVFKIMWDARAITRAQQLKMAGGWKH